MVAVEPVHWKFDTEWDDPDLEWSTSASGTRSAMLDFGDVDDEDRPMVVVVAYPPNCRVAPHHHETDYLSLMVQGDMFVTGRRHEVGSMRFVGHGTGYGPLEIGEDGCTVIDIFLHRSGLIPVFGPREGVTAEQHEVRRQSLAARAAAVPRRRN